MAEYVIYDNNQICEACGRIKPLCSKCKQPLSHGYAAGTFLPCEKCFPAVANAPSLLSANAMKEYGNRRK